ncbi:MAG TPA: hypothetical protein VL172_10305, partial [Kofleriaceae bacterium]|nr:hypothetical protein [Kofleriaceae bacterium]
ARTPAAGDENEDFRMAFVLVTRPGQTIDDAAAAIDKLEIGRLAWEHMHRDWTFNRSTMCTDVSAPCPLAFAEVGDITVTEGDGADGDGILEPGEDLVATTSFANAGAQDATTAVAELTSTSDAVEPPAAETLPLIAAGGSLEHGFPFRIAGDACGQEIDLTITATIGTRTWKASTTFRPGVIDREPESFATDAGWVANPRTTDSATSGQWEHGIPEATFFAGRTLQPDGGYGGATDPAWFTGPFDAWDDGEVAGGATTLVSAPYDLTGYVDPILRYRVWYTAYDRPAGSLAVAPESHLTVEYSLDDGVTWQVIDQVSGEPVRWQPREVPFATGIEPGAAVRFRFTAFDDLPSTARLVEVGIDDVAVASLSPSCRDGGGGGCCSAGGPPQGGALLLGGIVAILLARRRGGGAML